MITFQYHPDARDEYIEAAKYYEQRQSGLGARFSIEIEAAVSRILESPMRWPVIEQDVRRYLTHIFPYGILYTVEEDFILILAVMHCGRKPGYWKERLKN